MSDDPYNTDALDDLIARAYPSRVTGPITLREAMKRYAAAHQSPDWERLTALFNFGFRVVDPAEYGYRPRRTRKVPLYIRKGGVRK